MKKAFRTIAAVLAVVAISLMMFGCGDHPGKCVLGDKVAEYANKVITVTLPSNPTTGYTWSYSIEGTNVVNSLDEYTASTSTAAGAGGTQTYKFDITGRGEATIYFTYARSWEETESDEHLRLIFTADGSGYVQNMSFIG